MILVYQARFESEKGTTRYSTGFVYLEMHSIEQSIVNKNESSDNTM